MPGFCKYCGSSLGEDGSCTCEKYIASANAVQENEVSPAPATSETPVSDAPVAPTAPAPQVTYAPPPAVPSQPSKFAEMSRQQFNTSKKMFLDFIKDPIGMISSISTTSDKTSPLIFGGIHVLILLLSVWLGLGEASKYTFKLGWVFAIIDIITTVALSGAVYFLAKKYTPETTFMNTLCAFCIATIPSSIMIIASLLIGIVLENIAALLIVMSLISWLIIAFTSALELIKTNRNTVFWFFLGVLAVILIIDWSILSENISNIFSQILYSSIF